MENKLSMITAINQTGTDLFEMTDEQISDFANELMIIDKAEPGFLYNRSKKIASVAVEFKELIMMYTCAMKEVRTKLEILNIEYNVKHQRNPINSIATRIKSVTSILEKMKRNSIHFSIANIESNIHDVAGLRVICSYVDDIYALARALGNQGDIEIISNKDYIANPKPNGYRSLHLIVSVPVFFIDHTKNMKVEIQIRTIAMDFWATLEHQMKYRRQLIDGEEIARQLKECAQTISDTDSRMLDIRKLIEANSGEPTEEDILFEKMRQFGSPIE